MINNLCGKLNLLNVKLKQKHIFFTLAMFFSTLIGTLTAYAQELFDVRVVIDGKWHVYNTNMKTVSELLEKNKIELDKKDIIDTALDTPIDRDMIIKINKAEDITFVIDNKKEKSFKTNQSTIGVALKEFNEETNQNLFLDQGQSSAADVEDNMKIYVSNYTEKTKTTQEDIPFETKTVENPNIYVGNSFIKVKGEKGIKEIKTKEIYKNDELVSSEKISEEIKKQPIAQVIEKGTKQYESSTPVVSSKNTIKTEKGVFTVSKKLNMRSTAYTAGPESTGKRPGDKGYGITASGMKAQRGVVAVDTRVIPIGTKLYIEGYGYAIAGDTGSAIKGNKIDVFLDSYTDAINYGVRNVDVYVLGDKVS